MAKLDKYLIREFTVCKREDSRNLIIDCETFVARLFSDYSYDVEGTPYGMLDFNETFSINIP